MKILPVSFVYLVRILPCGASVFSKTKLTLFTFVLFTKRRVGATSRPAWKFLFRFRQKKFYCFLADEFDIQTFVAVFVEEQYRIECPKPDTIVDLGSNIGLSIIYFAIMYPESKIFGFEPNPHIFSRLKENIAPFKMVAVFPYAAGKDAEVSFFLSHTKSVSSSLRNRSQGSERIFVLSKSLTTICSLADISRIDLLKFDIEGAEEEVFSDPEGLSRVQCLVGEVHTKLLTESRETFLSRFQEFKTRVFEKGKERFILTAHRYEPIS
jgi:FkbM family methyltransferase